MLSVHVLEDKCYFSSLSIVDEAVLDKAEGVVITGKNRMLLVLLLACFM